MDYYSSPYERSFKAKITKIKESGARTLISLSRSFFFPGGGGQACDKGTLKGKNASAEVLEVFEDGTHLCKLNGELAEGEEVECNIDWDRRYKMMKAHSGQHILFQSLSRVFKNIEVVKVRFEPDDYRLFAKNIERDFKKLGQAELLANKIISENKKISATTLPYDSLKNAGFRAKPDRIHGDVRVIEVEGFDKAACSGLHVAQAGEIGAIAIKKVGESGGVFDVELEIGERAREFLIEQKSISLAASDILQTTPDKLEKTALNLMEEAASLRASLKNVARQLLEGITYKELAGIKIYSGIFSGLGGRELSDKAGKLIDKENAVVVLGGENGFLLLAASSQANIDMRKIAELAFSEMSGKFGGKGNFIMGSGDGEKLGNAVNRALSEINKIIAK